jgi:hypothetical protein
MRYPQARSSGNPASDLANSAKEISKYIADSGGPQKPRLWHQTKFKRSGQIAEATTENGFQRRDSFGKSILRSSGRLSGISSTAPADRDCATLSAGS